MQRRSLVSFFALCICLVSTHAAAVKIKGHNIADNIMLENTHLVLNGAGVRSKWFISLYIASLYLTEKSSDSTEILKLDNPVQMDLLIISSLITPDKMASATREGFETSTHDNTQPIAEDIETFVKVFSEDIKEGDVFTLAYVPGQGVMASKNGTLKATIAGKEFAQAMFGMWISPDNIQSSLRGDLLN